MIKKQTKKIMPLCLFAFYLLLVLWIILFKMSFSLESLDRYRRISFIPFRIYYLDGFTIDEFFGNIIVFVPFGMYLKMLGVGTRITLLSGALTSLALEICQYFLNIGASDITDLITNTFGALVGVLVYFATKKLFKSKRKTHNAINLLASIITVAFVALIIVMLAFGVRIEF